MIDYTKPWGLALSPSERPEVASTSAGGPALQITLDGDGLAFAGGKAPRVVIHFFQETDGQPLYPALAMRIFCHAFLGLLPDKGLPELCESLAQLVDFYRLRPEAAALEAPSHRTLPGRIGRTYTRPEFPAVDE